jgi:alpha-beta hydrolase superfamily lysophospholipase
LTHSSSSFQTADGFKIHTAAWLPDQQPRAVVLLVHGLSEHSGRYAHVATRFVEQNYAVYALDHRGHGQSEGLRSYFDSLDQPVNDLKQYLDAIKAADPDKRIFVYGHSLGSLITLVFLLRYQQEVSGAIISANTLGVEFAQPRFLITASSVLNNLIPKQAVAPPLPSAALSHDPVIVKDYDTDPLNYRGKVRVRMGYLILQASRQVRERMHELTLPLLIFHGGADKICPPNGSQLLYESVESPDRTLKFYPGLYHETHNELEKETVLADIVNWLNAH